jgi:hypothetical protein
MEISRHWIQKQEEGGMVKRVLEIAVTLLVSTVLANEGASVYYAQEFFDCLDEVLK